MASSLYPLPLSVTGPMCTYTVEGRMEMGWDGCVWIEMVRLC